MLGLLNDEIGSPAMSAVIQRMRDSQGSKFLMIRSKTSTDAYYVNTSSVRGFSCIVTLDNGTKILVDTGSTYSLITEEGYEKMLKSGECFVKKPKTNKREYFGAGDTNLGYHHRLK